jgi:hypothetical protein
MLIETINTNNTDHNSLFLLAAVVRDRMVVGFTTTNAINAYHHLSCEFEFCS